MSHPVIIQGGMGVAVSDWALARAVSRLGALGVVSGTALAAVLARRLEAGDPTGDMRRALAHFPLPAMAERVLARYYFPGGKPAAQSFTLTPMPATLHIAVVDTETTGLSAATDRIIEVAVKLLAITAAGELINEVEIYQSLHDPGIRIPRDAIAVHGITDAMVRGHCIDASVLSDILARADLVIAHNSGFDKGFVRQVVPHADTLRWGCSCRGIPWKQHYPRLWSTSLPVLAQFLKLPTGTAHRALGDVETTVNLLLRTGPSGEAHVAHLLRRKLRVGN